MGVTEYPTEASYRQALRTRITEPAERSGWLPELCRYQRILRFWMSSCEMPKAAFFTL